MSAFLRVLSSIFCTSLLVLSPFSAAALTETAVTARRNYEHQIRDVSGGAETRPNDNPVRVDIALRQGQSHRLEKRLYEVAEPESPSFRQFLSDTEVNRLIRPTKNTISAVERWLFDHGISGEQLLYNSAKDWVTVKLPASKAASLLGTGDDNIHGLIRKRTHGDKPTWSTLNSRSPYHDIDWIQASYDFQYSPSTKIDFPRSVETDGSTAHRNKTTPPTITDLNQAAESLSHGFKDNFDLKNLPTDLSAYEACNTSAVTPLCVRALYGTLHYTPKVSYGNSMALVNFDGEFNNRSDIDLFLQQFRPEAADGRAAWTFSEENYGGAINWQQPPTPEQLARKDGREGNVDAQALLSIAWPVPLITYSVGKSLHPPFKPDLYTPTNTNEPFLIWLKDLLERPNYALPKVLSISYGDIEHTVPYAYAKRVCNSFAQLGARGVTVIFGSGDSGLGKEGYCRSNDGKDSFEFLTSFPDSCPFGTSVGATRQEKSQAHSFDSTHKDAQIIDIPAHNPSNGFVTGGGFSKYFARPSYQDAAVQSYLASNPHLTNTSSTHTNSKHPFFNSLGRAYPDVSISGYRRTTTWNGQNYLIDGTSVSAPTFAAVVALVNDALLDAGKAPLGFLNPWLYRVGKRAFRDVTVGNVSGCAPGMDFEAGEGWDPVGGWGVPWLPKFKELALGVSGHGEGGVEDLGLGEGQRPWYWGIE